MRRRSLVLTNANVITLNQTLPRAQAIAIGNGQILEVGSTEEVAKHVTDETEVIDLQGKTVVPGFVDSHIHMLGFGAYPQQLELRNARSIKELQNELGKHAKRTPHNGWILGRGWDHERLSEHRYPTRWDIDAAVKEQPVFLIRICGHIGVVNSKALALAGLDEAEGNVRDLIGWDADTGKPNGVVKEEALDLVWRVTPKPSLEEVEGACINACERVIEAGLTCVHWLAASADELRAVQELSQNRRLPIRVYLGIPVEMLQHLVGLGLITGFGNERAKLGFVKFFADGSLGGHTAALNAPYSDKPETMGVMLYTQRRLNRLILEVHKAGLQVAVHAIGDRALTMVLDAYKRAFKRIPRRDHRNRIEHCSVLNPRLIKYMQRLGITASVQPHFIVSDFWVSHRVGAHRARWVYPFRSLLDAGIVVVAGSDWPVEPVKPLTGMWAAVTRKDSHGENVTAEEALKMYTLNAAYASFDEDRKGSIETGKFADLTVLSHDPLTISPGKIKDVCVEMVIVDGEKVYRKP